MKRILFSIILFTAAISFGQNIPSKLGNLAKADFEKWTEQLTINGIKFTEFEHQEDAYQANYMKDPSNSVTILVREDDGSANDKMMKAMNYTIYDRKGLKHYYNTMEGTTMIMVIIPKLKIHYNVAVIGTKPKEALEKILDQTKIYEK